MKNLNIPLSWQIVLAAIVAVIIGRLFPAVSGFAGEIAESYMRLLMLLIPYFVCAVVSAFTSSDDKGFSLRITLKTLTGFVGMEIIAGSTALLVANIFFANTNIEALNLPAVELDTSKTLGDFFFNIIPHNFVDILRAKNLPFVILISCIIGYYANKCSDKSRLTLTKFFSSCNELMHHITGFMAALSPIGIFGITCKLTAEGVIFDSFHKILPLVIAAGVSLLLHSLVFVPILLKSLAKCQPYRLFKMFGSVLWTSLGFSSSTLSATLAMHRMKEESGISSKISGVTMPVLTILNFNGTSIFLTTAILFIAQAYGINLSLLEQIILIFTVSFITIGNVAAPLKLSVLIFPVLESMGVPLEGMGVIVACDIFFGMLCSAADTWSNVAVTTVIARSEDDKIKV
ncbi:MAG: cation:dicarboxylase symporter family transporter [Bacteroidales bacterium]|nr:cation:dicarboxylase symporter family transporter [Bacteroidales bacterium]